MKLNLLAAILGAMGSCMSHALAFQTQTTPYALRKKGSSECLRYGFQAGQPRLTALTKEITITWQASALENRSQPPDFTLPIDLLTDSVGGNVYQSGYQTLTTRFTPTACCVIDAQSLLIGGMTTSGETIVERWLFTWPDPMPAPATNIATGLTKVAVALPTVQTTSRIYSGSATGKQYVRNICGLRRSSGATINAIVQFFDSNDLYVIDLASGHLSLLASPTNASGSLGVVSTLSCSCQDEIKFGDRTGTGYSYTFRMGGTVLTASPSASDPPQLILLDADRNGTIDSYVQLSWTSYTTQGWNKAENYTGWWLP